VSGGRAKVTSPTLWRLAVVALCLLILFGMLISRLVILQVVDQDRGARFLQQQGAMRTIRTSEIPAYRGLVTDRRGQPLAVSTPVVSIWANPQLLTDPAQIERLAPVLGASASALSERIKLYADKQFMYLARHQTPEQARAILDLGLSGVHGEREYRRFYPAGEVASQLVGLTNVDGEGISGIELAYNDWLRGQTGKKRYLKDLHGDAIRNIGVIEQAQSGKPLALSIDLRLQYLQHRVLQRAMVETGANAGAAVTLDETIDVGRGSRDGSVHDRHLDRYLAGAHSGRAKGAPGPPKLR